MKILYLGEDPNVEYHEIKIFQQLGHTVFSIGEQCLGEPPSQRQILDYNVDDTLVEEFKRLHPNYVSGGAIAINKKFAKLFDLIVVSHFPTHLTMNWKLLREVKMVWVWRDLPKHTPMHYMAVTNLKGKGLKTVQLPRSGHYMVDECKKIWTDFFSICK